MAGSKGCQDDFASFVIFALNSILLIMSILGLVGVGYVWVTQNNLQGGGEAALSVVIPEFVLITGIVVIVLVMVIALLGIIATACQMKENKEGGGKICAKPGSKDWWYSCGMTIYVFLCVFAFFFLLAVAIVAGVYSDKLSQFSSLDNVRDQGDSWLDKLEAKTESQVIKLADKYPITWNNTQAAMGCCGWSINEQNNITAFTNSKCCNDKTVVNSVNVIGKVEFDYAGCKEDGDGKVYTCEGIVATRIKGNLVKASISTAALALLQLSLAICGCVVRFPKLFAYCNICKKKTDSESVAPSETEVTKFKKTESSGDI